MANTGTRLNILLRGYLLLFEWRQAAAYTAATGAALLVVFCTLEYAVGPRTHILNMLGIDQPAPWQRVLALTALAVLGARLVGARFSDIGLLRPTQWTSTEVLYLAQAITIGVAILVVVNFDALRSLPSMMWPTIALAYVTQLIWGFYQELIYRGILQTELVRTFGAVAGIVVANIAFTIGPLHFHELAGPAPDLAKEIMFGSIFAIGLIFGYLMHRTRNIVFVGLLHGIGDAVSNVPHVFQTQ